MVKTPSISALIFAQPEKTWYQNRQTYLVGFKALVFGYFPEEKEILKSISLISERLKRRRLENRNIATIYHLADKSI